MKSSALGALVNLWVLSVRERNVMSLPFISLNEKIFPMIYTYSSIDHYIIIRCFFLGEHRKAMRITHPDERSAVLRSVPRMLEILAPTNEDE